MAKDDDNKVGMKKSGNRQSIGQTYEDEALEEIKEEELVEIKNALLVNIIKGMSKLKKLYQEITLLNKISVLTHKNQVKRGKTGDVNDQNQAVVSKNNKANSKTAMQIGDNSQTKLPTQHKNSQSNTIGAFTEVEMMLKKGASKTKTVLKEITKVPALFKKKLEQVAKKHIDNFMGRSL